MNDIMEKIYMWKLLLIRWLMTKLHNLSTRLKDYEQSAADSLVWLPSRMIKRTAMLEKLSLEGSDYTLVGIRLREMEENLGSIDHLDIEELKIYPGSIEFWLSPKDGKGFAPKGETRHSVKRMKGK